MNRKLRQPTAPLVYALRRTLLLAACCLWACAAAGQDAAIDSLKQVLATTRVDTVKAQALCDLCVALTTRGRMDEARAAGEAGLKLAERKKYRRGTGRCLQCLGGLYQAQGDMAKAGSFFDKSIKIYEALGDRTRVAAALSSLGSLYSAQGDFPRAIASHEKSIKLYESSGEVIGVAQNMTNLGLLYKDQGDHVRALDNFQKSLKIAEKNRIAIGIAINTSNIGIVYQEQGNYDAALEYYGKSLKTLEKLGFRQGVAAAQNNIGAIYTLKNDDARAMERYRQSMEIYEEIGDRQGVANALHNIGNIYEKQKEYDKALEGYEQCLKIQEETGATAAVAGTLSAIARLKHTKGDAPEGRRLAQRGLALAQDVGHLNYMKYNAEILYKADSTLGNWRGAFDALHLFKQYADSLKNDEKSRELGRIETRFEFEKQVEEQKRAAAEAARIEEGAATRRNSLQYLSIFAGLIALFAGVSVLARFRIPVRALDVGIFVVFLIVFEFLLVLLDPFIEDYSEGVPLYKLGLNTLVAFVFAPAHHYFTRILRDRLANPAEHDPAA